MKYYFTLGQNHTHRVNGHTIDKDCVVEVEGNFEEARQKMFDACGTKWAFQYTKEDIQDSMHHFPRGIIKLEGSQDDNI